MEEKNLYYYLEHCKNFIIFVYNYIDETDFYI